MLARYGIIIFLVLGLVVLPLVVLLLCRILLPRKARRWVAGGCIVLIWGMVGYGFLIGFKQFRVTHVELAFSDLPAAFDGYRIVQFSDAHLGTMWKYGQKELLERAMDSIDALKPDVVLFTGDLQNVYPSELEPYVGYFKRIHTPDGVYSVLGNHDYDVYQDCAPQEKQQNCHQTCVNEQKLGFTLLLNDHRIIRRDSDSIVIAGMENWGQVERMPRRGDVKKALAGIDTTAFVIMMEHDPSAWRQKILPECYAQLTLSGHTHGGQFSLLGWSPVALSYSEWSGTTHEGQRALHVSTGLGALIPFRFGMPGEIVVITLKVKK